jgi:hypothetical protein
MKFLLITGIVAGAVLASAATVLRSHTPATEGPVGGTLSLAEVYAAAGVNKMPIENFEDRFEAWSTPAKQ